MLIPPVRPAPLQLWRSYDPISPEAVRVLDIFTHPDWGNYVMYQPIHLFGCTYPPPLISEKTFIGLYYLPEDEEPSCDPSTAEKSSSTTSSQPRRPWFTALRERWNHMILFFRQPW